MPCMGKPCPPKAVLWELDIEQEYSRLKDNDPLKIAIRKGRDILTSNMYAGAQIPKRQIPKYYVRENGVNNLYVLRLDYVKRLCYMLTESNVGVKEIFLDHKSYNRRFGYK